MNVIVVRREKVLLEVESEVAAALTRDAAAAALLTRELNRLSGQSVTTGRATQNVSRDNDTIARSASTADASINKLTGRLRLMADVAAILGPALVPIGALGVPAVAGLANQLGVAALAGGTAIIAFQGVGDALKAVNTAALEPTTANLQKAQEAMENLSPAAREMVNRLQELRPVLAGIRDAGAEGMFPGVIDGIDELEKRAGDFERIVGNMGSALGSLLADAGADLASDRWDDFFDFLATDATQTLASMGRATGSLAHGMAELWMAFDPLNDDFGSWVEDVASGFDSWATGLSQTQGFAEFIDYVRSTGPQVADTFVALADAVLEIAEAAAPLGGPVLQALEGIAKAAAAIADSDLGTPIMAGVAALALLSRATRTYQAVASTAFGGRLVGSIGGMVTALGTVTTAQDRARLSAVQLQRAEAQRASAVRGGLATMGKSAAVLGALAVSATGAADGIGLTNTASLGLIGTLAGPWGAAVGGATGLLLDLGAANDSFEESIRRTAEVAESGSLPQMRERLAEIHQELGRLGNDNSFGANLERISIAFGSMVGTNELARYREEAERLQEAIYDATHPDTGRGLGSLLGDLGVTDAAFDAATQSAQEFRTAMARVNTVLDGRSDLRDYQAALDDFSTALKDNQGFLNRQRTGFRRTTEAGRNVEAALDGIAATALAAAETMEAMDRVRYLQQARRDFIAAARQAGLTRAAARELADQLGLVGRIKARPTVGAQGIPETRREVKSVDRDFRVLDRFMANPTMQARDQASGPISWVREALTRLDGDRATVTITTVRETINRVTTLENFIPWRRATGGPIIGPGTGTSDSVPVLASHGEHMWTAREVANAGGHAAMEAMRAQFRARPFHTRGTTGTQRIAVTATTGPLSANTSLSDRDIDRLAAALYAAARAGMSDRATAGQRRLTAALATGGGF